MAAPIVLKRELNNPKPVPARRAQGSVEDRMRHLEEWASQIGSSLQEGLRPKQRFLVCAREAGQKIRVPHDLGRVPTGFKVMNRTGQVNVTKSAAEWTKDAIYIEVDNPNVDFDIEVS